MVDRVSRLWCIMYVLTKLTKTLLFDALICSMYIEKCSLSYYIKILYDKFRFRKKPFWKAYSIHLHNIEIWYTQLMLKYFRYNIESDIMLYSLLLQLLDTVRRYQTHHSVEIKRFCIKINLWMAYTIPTLYSYIYETLIYGFLR